MTGAELKTLRESLGLTVQWVADQSKVRLRTAQYWEAGRNKVPADVAALIARTEARTRTMVANALAQIDEVTQAQVGTLEAVDLRRYASDAELWRKHPDCKPLPATWHATMLARITRALEAKGVSSTIQYASLTSHR